MRARRRSRRPGPAHRDGRRVDDRARAPPRRSGTSRHRPRPAAPRHRPHPRSCRRSRSPRRGRPPGSGATERLAVPPPDARICAGAGQPGRGHEVEAVAEAEGDALEDRPRHVPPVVADGQADERAARQRIRVRAALAGQVRQEEQPVAAGAGPRLAAATRSPNSTPGASASRNQRRLPAADSITDIMCHRPGTAWQNAWTRPAGSNSGRSVAAKTTPGRPERQRHRARARRPRRRPHWPTGRRRRRRPASRRRSPVASAAATVSVPVIAGPSNVSGSQAGSMPRAVDHLGGPVARGQVEQERAGAIGLVDGVTHRSAGDGRSPWAAARGRPAPRCQVHGREPRRPSAP